MIKLSKLKNNLDRNKILFLFILLIIGIITGAILFVSLKNNDYNLVKEEITNYFSNLNKINLNNYLLGSIISNLGILILIWLLGISVIGVPIIIFIYFFKCFLLGFTISSFIAIYSVKGIILSLIFVLFQILNYISLIIVITYSINMSINIINAILKKKPFDFKIIITKYLKILVICSVLMLIYILFDNYLLPLIFKLMV